MKVYTCPTECPAPTPDYTNYDSAKEIRAEKDHQEQLAKWLRANGFNGKHTGGIYRQGVADGYAMYMLADGPKSCLIHLPYGDAYQARDVEYVPKKEIIRRIEAEKKFREIWDKKS